MTFSPSPSDIVIVGAARTAVGAFNGSLAAVVSTDLGAAAVRGALERAAVPAADVDEVILGNVLAAGAGQNPARQAALKAGVPNSVPCTTINKVCSSGLKAITLAAAAIKVGDAKVVVAGGFESMSNAPYVLPSAARSGLRMGHAELSDTVIKDGLWDAFENKHMGLCAERCAKEYSFTREEQDAYARQSYERAYAAQQAGVFRDEIVPVTVNLGRGKTATVDVDEDVRVDLLEKMGNLRTPFLADGTITAGNASGINDGAAAVVLMTRADAEARSLPVVATVLGYADAAHEPEMFTTAPSLAVPLALKKAGVDVAQVDIFEVNEAFSVVALANAKLIGAPLDKVNVHGGGVSIGHPLGCSGARIVLSAISALKRKNGGTGIAAVGICNGGGGASALVFRMDA